jgi:hypothetical protein
MHGKTYVAEISSLKDAKCAEVLFQRQQVSGQKFRVLRY